MAEFWEGLGVLDPPRQPVAAAPQDEWWQGLGVLDDTAPVQPVAQPPDEVESQIPELGPVPFAPDQTYGGRYVLDAPAFGSDLDQPVAPGLLPEQDPLGFGEIAQGELQPANPFSIINPDARTFADLTPDEQRTYVEQQAIRNAQSPEERQRLIAHSAQQDAARYPGTDPMAPLAGQVAADSEQAEKVAKQIRAIDHGLQVNEFRLKNLQAAGRTEEANKLADHLNRELDERNRLVSQHTFLAGRGDTRYQQLQKQYDKIVGADRELTVPEETVARIEQSINEMPEGPEKDAAFKRLAETKAHNAQVKHDIEKARQRGMTVADSRAYEEAGLDLDRSQMAGGSVTSSVPWRMAETMGQQFFGKISEAAHTAAVELDDPEGAARSQRIRDQIRQHNRLWQVAQERMDMDSPVPMAGAIRQAGAAVGESLLAAQLGGLPTLAGYYSAGSLADSLALADEEGRTGWQKYGPAVAHAGVEGAMTYLGGKVFGAGTGKLADRQASSWVNRAIERGAARYNLGPALSGTAVVFGETFGGAAGEIFEEVTTELQHYLVDKATYGDQYKGAPLGERLWGVVAVSGLAGGGGGLASSKGGVRSSLDNIAKLVEQRERSMQQAKAATDALQAKVDSNAPISRGDLERVGVPSGGTSAASRKKLASDYLNDPKWSTPAQFAESQRRMREQPTSLAEVLSHLSPQRARETPNRAADLTQPERNAVTQEFVQPDAETQEFIPPVTEDAAPTQEPINVQQERQAPLPEAPQEAAGQPAQGETAPEGRQEAERVLEPPAKRPSLYKNTNRDAIPEDMEVDVRAVRLKTGERVAMKQNAKEAVADLQESASLYKKLLDCLKS